MTGEVSMHFHNRGGGAGTVQSPGLNNNRNAAEMAGSQTAGREHVPEGKGSGQWLQSRRLWGSH